MCFEELQVPQANENRSRVNFYRVATSTLCSADALEIRHEHRVCHRLPLRHMKIVKCFCLNSCSYSISFGGKWSELFIIRGLTEANDWLVSLIDKKERICLFFHPVFPQTAWFYSHILVSIPWPAWFNKSIRSAEISDICRNTVNVSLCVRVSHSRTATPR